MPVIMIVIAGTATHLRRLSIYQGNNRVIRYTTALNTVVVNHIT